MHPKTVPFKVWLFSLVIVLIFLFLGLLIPEQVESNNIQINKLIKLKSINNGTKKSIVTIGTSLLGHALYPDKEMNNLAKAYNIQDMNYLRFPHGGRDLEYFNNLFNALCKYKPNVVVLDASLMFYFSKDMLDINEPIFKFTKKIKDYIKNSFGHAQNSLNYEDRIQSSMDKTTNIKIFKWKKNLNQWIKRGHNLSASFLHFIQYANANNIKLYIVDFSRAHSTQNIFPNKYSNYENRMILEYSNRYNINYRKYPVSLSKEYFIDYAHANNRGRKVISEWFVLTMEDILNGKIK